MSTTARIVTILITIIAIVVTSPGADQHHVQHVHTSHASVTKKNPNPEWCWIKDIHQSERDDELFHCLACGTPWRHILDASLKAAGKPIQGESFSDTSDGESTNHRKNNSNGRQARKPPTKPSLSKPSVSFGESTPDKVVSALSSSIESAKGKSLDEIQELMVQQFEKLRVEESKPKPKPAPLLTDTQFRKLLSKKDHQTEQCRRKLSKLKGLESRLEIEREKYQELQNELKDINLRIELHKQAAYQERNKSINTNIPSVNTTSVEQNAQSMSSQFKHMANLFDEETLQKMEPQQVEQARDMHKQMQNMAEHIASFQGLFEQRANLFKQEVDQLKQDKKKKQTVRTTTQPQGQLHHQIQNQRQVSRQQQYTQKMEHLSSLRKNQLKQINPRLNHSSYPGVKKPTTRKWRQTQKTSLESLNPRKQPSPPRKQKRILNPREQDWTNSASLKLKRGLRQSQVKPYEKIKKSSKNTRTVSLSEPRKKHSQTKASRMAQKSQNEHPYSHISAHVIRIAPSSYSNKGAYNYSKLANATLQRLVVALFLLISANSYKKRSNKYSKHIKRANLRFKQERSHDTDSGNTSDNKDKAPYSICDHVITTSKYITFILDKTVNDFLDFSTKAYASTKLHKRRLSVHQHSPRTRYRSATRHHRKLKQHNKKPFLPMIIILIHILRQNNTTNISLVKDTNVRENNNGENNTDNIVTEVYYNRLPYGLEHDGLSHKPSCSRKGSNVSNHISNRHNIRHNTLEHDVCLHNPSVNVVYNQLSNKFTSWSEEFAEYMQEPLQPSYEPTVYNSSYIIIHSITRKRSVNLGNSDLEHDVNSHKPSVKLLQKTSANNTTRYGFEEYAALVQKPRNHPHLPKILHQKTKWNTHKAGHHSKLYTGEKPSFKLNLVHDVISHKPRGGRNKLVSAHKNILPTRNLNTAMYSIAYRFFKLEHDVTSHKPSTGASTLYENKTVIMTPQPTIVAMTPSHTPKGKAVSSASLRGCWPTSIVSAYNRSTNRFMHTTTI